LLLFVAIYLGGALHKRAHGSFRQALRLSCGTRGARFRTARPYQAGGIGAGLEALRHRVRPHPFRARYSLLHSSSREICGEAIGSDGKAPKGSRYRPRRWREGIHEERWWCVAELMRIKKAKLILGSDGSAPQAADGGRGALLALRSTWARRQDALSWELANIHKPRGLTADQGRIAEARSLLQTVVRRFSEGCENADLKTREGVSRLWARD